MTDPKPLTPKQLGAVQRTLLSTLHARALDHRSVRPVLGDAEAARVADRLGADLGDTGMSGTGAVFTALRAKLFDERTERFLAAHPDAVVLNLGCGLDARAWRVTVPPGVRWYDVDQPEVIALRRRVFGEPPPGADHHLLAASVTDPEWFAEVPADRTVLVLAEGLAPYLDEADVLALLRRISTRFPRGEIVLDVIHPWVVALAHRVSALRQTGTTFRWGLGDPRGLTARVPGLRLLHQVRMTTRPELDRLPIGSRVAARVASALPGPRDGFRVLRLAFERERRPVSLRGAPETMLATLRLRALDARGADPILGDRWAERAVRRLDYDFDRFRKLDRNPASVAIRAQALDREVRRVLRPGMTVLHLGCGLDARYERIAPPADVAWYDVDHPDVIALRRAVLPVDAPGYRAVGSSVTDPALLRGIPGDRPVLVIAEGLTMYLSEQDGRDLLRRITAHFPAGHLIFDAFNTLGVEFSRRFNPAVVTAGARLGWAIDDPRELPVPGVELAEEWSFDQAPEIARFSPPFRLFLRAWGRITPLRRMGRVLHYRF
ncbi:class I SAM-dependent methyltransferase [Saccharopolyspora sp. CA-218241]|uniref:class I SAM-dependent methyltransferase n=1 Tax=Saccharopolyspora sp. CA-218241 TaxID=3240027 RepID=UPI003D995EEB